MLETCQTGIAVADSNGFLINVNYELLSIYGYTDPEDMLNNHVSIFFYEPEQAMKVIKTLQEHGTCNEEMIIKRKDNSVIPVLLRAFMLTTESGKKIMYGSIKDISDIKNVEKYHKRLIKERYLSLTEVEKKLLGLMSNGLYDWERIAKIMGWEHARTVYKYLSEIEKRLFIERDSINEFINENKFLFDKKTDECR